MSFDWAEYLNLAQELVGQTTIPSSKEAKLRSAISRAYYAAFCKARNHLRDREGHVIPKKNTHWYVIDQFNGSPDKLHRWVGRDLERMRRDRNKADYADMVSGLPRLMILVLKQAQRTLSNVTHLT